MGGAKWDLAVDAAVGILETLSIVDYVNIVLFSSTAEVIQGTYLLRATAENKAILINALNNYAPGIHTPHIDNN
jgi:hypothetical protein